MWRKGVATWELKEDNKGCDDLIVNHGIEAFEEVMDNLIPYKEWLQSLERQVSNQSIQAKTAYTKNLLELGQVSQVEIDWLRENLLTQVEIEQLETTQNTHNARSEPDI